MILFFETHEAEKKIIATVTIFLKYIYYKYIY